MSNENTIPPRWYCVSADGLATLCKDEEDARHQAAYCDTAWPRGGPHRAVVLGDVMAERERWRTMLRTPHRMAGACPDEVAGEDSRDLDCPACRLLMELS